MNHTHSVSTGVHQLMSTFSSSVKKHDKTSCLFSPTTCIIVAAAAAAAVVAATTTAEAAAAGPSETDIVPFLRQLSDHANDKILLQQRNAAASATKRGVAPVSPSAAATAAAATAAVAATSPASGEDCPSSAATGGGIGSGGGGADGIERLDAERQVLLTMLLAHMCSEHDATPRTFVEQVGD